MSKNKILMAAFLAFCAGIMLASSFLMSSFHALFGVAAGALALLASLAFKGRYKRFSLMAAVILFFSSAGLARFNQTKEANEFAGNFETKVKWEGVVVEEPDIRPDRQLIAVRPDNRRQRVLITIAKGREFFYGDRVAFEGKLKEPKTFSDFDYPGYLARFRIYAIMQYPKIFILKSGQGSAVKSALLKTKRAFAERMRKFLPEPQNSLALGILIGARRGLPPEITESFNLTGTSHIVAISGFNIAVIAAGLGALAWIVGRRASFWLSFAVILGFVVIAGASASVVRAAVMGVLLLLAFSLGRLYAAIPALFFAAGWMLYFNPKILFWDAGFQLSFAATLGLILFMPILEKLTSGWPKAFGLKAIFLATLSATASTLPLVLWHFGRLSLVSLLANILILPVVPFAMLFGFLTATPFLAPGFAFLANLLLSYILWTVQALGRLPFASVSAGISRWGFFGLLAALFGLYLLLKAKAKKLKGKADAVAGRLVI